MIRIMIHNMLRQCSVCIPILLVFILHNNNISRCHAAEESTEQLYRRTVQNWNTNRNSWKPWNDYTADLLARWTSATSSTSSSAQYYRQEGGIRLQLIGGFEEGILAIEKETVARGEGANIQRDQTLSQLYGAYGRALNELTAIECHTLIFDPHTMLIGIESVKRTDDPSTFLCIENAENALRNSLTLDATNANAEKWLKQITGNDGSGVHKRKPKEFVAELFDSFADTFDEKLVKNLSYKVPELVGEAANKLRNKWHYHAVLDAGCGTGLAGRQLRPMIVEDGIMIGVDASQKMIDIAAKCTTHKGCGLGDEGLKSSDEEKPLYHDLLVMDLEEMTLESTHIAKSHFDESEHDHGSGFDLIVAADVLVYFGSLSNLLKTFARISTKGAGLIFSCELATEEEAPLGWRLLSSGRFSHTKQHAKEAAKDAGYDLVMYEEIVPRMERGEEVKGHLFTFALNDYKAMHSMHRGEL